MPNAPDFEYSRFYYAQILAGLMLNKRSSWSEHTEENEADPVVQLYRLNALIGHQASVRTDHVARELFWATLRLRSSAIALARHSDYELAPAAPSTVDLVADLTAGLSAPLTLVQAHSLFESSGTDSVVFEYASDEGLASSVTGAFLVVEDDGGTLTTHTGASLPASLWGGVPLAQDAIYFGHADLMFNKIQLHIDVAASGIDILHWEYYDPDRKGAPDSAINNSGQVRLPVATVYGSTGRASNTDAECVMRCLLTGVEETVTLGWDVSDGNFLQASGSLGQSTISTNPADYEVEIPWVALQGIVDATSSGSYPPAGDAGDDHLNQVGEELEVSWTLPQTTDRNWSRRALDAASADSVQSSLAYWIRARVVLAPSTPTSPTIDEPSEAAKTTYSVKWLGTQGQRIVETLGTTDSGSSGQAFDLARTDYMSLVDLTVAATAWTQVDNFLSSGSFDKHFTLLEQPDGTWRVTFGDGTNGRVPAASSKVVATYRVGGDVSGNLGADTITRDRSGNTRLKNVRNPRTGSGWSAKEGTTDASLGALRTKVPASLRTLTRAVTPEDHEDLAVAYRTSASRQLVARALAIEEKNGLKTVGLFCVTPAGTVPNSADLTELDEYFNGETTGLQRTGGVSLANQDVTSEAFNPRSVDVTVTVDVLADYADGADTAIEAALQSVLRPLATRLVLNADGEWEDSGDWLWVWGDLGGKVSVAQLSAAIATAVSGIVSINITTPAADIVLTTGQLPTTGTLAVTVNSV